MEIDKVKCSTPDFAEENAAKLLKLFPECEGEKGTVDLDKLRQVLSSKVIEGNVERYEFTWPGTRAAKAAASAATTKTLRPCREESVNFDTTENLYIEGDNLEVLKLLQTSYAGKVKMIYIDPPYNTGHDFVYRDRFSLTDKELAEEGGAFDEEGNRFQVNDCAEARYHSNWCSMMYPRLKLAKSLLADNGVIFISLDDNEVINARKLCDEIFYERNFVALIVVQTNPRGRTFDRFVSKTHEYVIVYAKDIEKDGMFSLPKDEKAIAEYSKQDEHGKYRLLELRNRNPVFNRTNRPLMFYPLYADPNTLEVSMTATERHTVEILPRNSAGEDGCWTWGVEKATKNVGVLVANHASTGKWSVFRKDYLEGDSLLTKAKGLWLEKEMNHENGKEMLGELFGQSPFDFPKSVGLLEKIIRIGNTKDGLILDFFSGSSTTAHAAMKLNAEDGGTRKFIMVQLPERCSDGSDSASTGFENICKIAEKRIQLAGKKILEENATTSPGLDVGFRVLYLDSSSLNDTAATVSETTQSFANFDRIKSDRSSEDLLFQMLLETHIPLSDKIERKEVGGNEVFFVSGTALVACLDAKAKMTSEFFMEIAQLKPDIAFFRDDAFADDSARTNLQQAFNQFSPSTSIKVI